jgi:ribosomal protein S2
MTNITNVLKLHCKQEQEIMKFKANVSRRLTEAFEAISKKEAVAIKKEKPKLELLKEI